MNAPLLKSAPKKIQSILGFLFLLLIGAIFVFNFISLTLGLVSRIHPTVALILGFLYLIAAGLFCPTLVRALGFSRPIRCALSHFVIVSAGIIAAFAGLSSALFSLDVADYERPDSNIRLIFPEGGEIKDRAERQSIHISRESIFVKYYGWLFIDMIPTLDVWRTLDRAAPLAPKNTMAGLLVIGFRCMVIAGLLASWREWKQLSNSDSQSDEPARQDNAG